MIVDFISYKIYINYPNGGCGSNKRSLLKLKSDSQKTKVAALNKEYESVLQGPGICDKQNDKQQAKSADKKGSRPEMTDAQKTLMKQQQVKRQEYD